MFQVLTPTTGKIYINKRLQIPALPAVVFVATGKRITCGYERNLKHCSVGR